MRRRLIMSDIIPVIVHHETGEKPQTGGKKNQEYLRYCIAQAKKYNEKVVLLGDQYNKDWCDDWHDANDFITDKWKEFHSVFKNLSPYPQAWAEGIFRRFFLILEYLDRYGYDNCVIMDSDILLYTNVSTYEPFRHCKMAAESPLEQDIAVLWKGNGYKWKVCAGVAYFTKQGLIEFTDYCIDMYKNHMDVLMEKWNIHQKYQIYAGVEQGVGKDVRQHVAGRSGSVNSCKRVHYQDSEDAKQAQQLKIGRTFMLHGVISCHLLEALPAFSARRILRRCWNLVFPCLMSAR